MYSKISMQHNFVVADLKTKSFSFGFGGTFKMFGQSFVWAEGWWWTCMGGNIYFSAQTG